MKHSVIMLGFSEVNYGSTDFFLCGVLGYQWSRVALGMMGKLCITVSFNEIYLWSVELNPTVVR